MFSAISEYTQGGWIPPQEPSRSWRAMIQSAQRRSAARRSDLTGR
jgi:hypothetical protein